MGTPSERFKNLREALGLTQNEFATKLGLNQTYISAIENGKRGVSSKLLRRLFESFQVSSDWIANGDGEMFIKNNITNYDKSTHLYKKEVGGNRYFKILNSGGDLSRAELEEKLAVCERWGEENMPPEPEEDYDPGYDLTDKENVRYYKLERNIYKLNKQFFKRFTHELDTKRHDLKEFITDTNYFLTFIRILEKIEEEYLGDITADVWPEIPPKQLLKAKPFDYEYYKQEQLKRIEQARKSHEGIKLLVENLNYALKCFLPFDTQRVIDTEDLIELPIIAAQHKAIKKSQKDSQNQYETKTEKQPKFK